ncbi:hypothetical protein [Spirosoma agri]|uniref:Uncharacterized protein n=1 Tax=Spirosoma agri TaxID=1987381 RepID=A0A6M0IRY7_9BACT|nr:hypothetical protein [Spirosoma agri]NEU69753.1 hypothetical protein [Spirosoma agri]
MKPFLGLLLGSSLLGHVVRGQAIDTVYSAAYLKKSTSFAWLHYGGDLLHMPGGQAPYSGGITNFSGRVVPRLTIGGIHFWGHADMYVTFPLPVSIGKRPAVFEESSYKEGVETGLRIYPIALAPNRLTPYVGICFKRQAYGQQETGSPNGKGYPELDRFIAPLQAGVTYTTNRFHLTAGLYYQANRHATYFYTPTQTGPLTFNPVTVNVGLVRYIDTDRSMAKAEGVQQENIKAYILRKNKKESSWYVGVGPSVALQLSKSSYFKEKHPYLHDDMTGGLMPDLTAGYYAAKPDLNIGVSYRTMGTHLIAYGTDIRLRRHSFMLEGYKFLFNYLGFVPYIGPTLALESLSATVAGGAENARYTQVKPAIGIIAGWDIRVTKTGSSLLRTNLRYTPGLRLNIGNESIKFDHLEFNFIQYVRFIGRNQLYKRYSNKR